MNRNVLKTKNNVMLNLFQHPLTRLRNKSAMTEKKNHGNLLLPLFRRGLGGGLLVLTICFSMSSAFAQTWPPAGMAGAGTEASPWQITTAAHLEALALYVNAGYGSNTNGKFYKMMNHIDLSGYSNWVPIGNGNNLASYTFQGTFDGNEKTVANLTINSTTLQYAGLFGYVYKGTVKNLGIIGNSSITITSSTIGTYAGGIVGVFSGSTPSTGTITNCYNTGDISASGTVSYAGGIVGSSSSTTTTITHCYNVGTISATSGVPTVTTLGAFAGGIASHDYNINHCYNIGDVYSNAQNGKAYAGGIAASFSTTSSPLNADNCYNTGNIVATAIHTLPDGFSDAYAGGVIGYIDVPASFAVITNCYNTGNTSAAITNSGGWARSGGITGRAYNSTINNCYNTGAISATSSASSQVYAGGIAYLATSSVVNNSHYLSGSAPDPGGGTVQTSAYMKTAAFETLLNSGPAPNSAYKFDIFNWNNGYPVLLWQTGGIISPIITTTTLPNGVVGTAYNAQLEADGTMPITWTKISGDLPAGLTLSTAGVVSGTPTTVGTSNFTVKAENITGSDTKPLSITIAAAIEAPTITTIMLPDGTVGTTYNQMLAATGTTPITWSLESGTLPAGLTLTPSGTDAGKISGTPTTAGSFYFVVKAQNSAGSDTKSLCITIITTVVAPTITTTSLPGGLTGTAYSEQLMATGTAPITWTKTSGNLPTGLTLSTTGLISGTPTATGTFSFTVKAENSAGSNTKTLSIVVTSSAQPPVITTTTLPNGTVGTGYNIQLAASGTAPITWAVSSGNLPTGLTLNGSGVISGTPTTAGTSNFTVKATNSAGNDTKPLSITVNPVPQIFITGKIVIANQAPYVSGVVELYKKSTYSLFMTTTTDNTGKYVFPDVTAGAYVIRAVPKNTDKTLAPTYYGNVEYWLHATTVTVVNTSFENMNITMIVLPEMNGSGAITGTVYEGEGGKKGITSGKGENPAPNIVVYLQCQQPDWKTVAYTTTNEDGYYEFPNIPANTYRVILDVVGIPMNDITVIELADGEEVSDINYIITDGGIDPVAIGELTIEMSDIRYPISDIAIYDIMGRTVGAYLYGRPKIGQSNIGQSEINISHFPTGMYFLRIMTEQGIATRKVIKN
jgi:hypothetical protein